MTENELEIEPIAELATLSGGARDAIADDGFSVGVIRRIGARRRRRAIMIGAAGSIGAAIAGSQLTTIFSVGPLQDMTVNAGVMGALTPEAFATIAIAGLVAIVGLIVPSRV